MERHAVIAGSGRSGTTFLIQFLSAAGVPTTDLGTLGYDEGARAGFEQSLLASDIGYLVKDPFFHEYAEIVDTDQIHVDCVIVPVRNLTDAAASRIARERARMGGDAAAEFYRRRQTQGYVPGGVVYSLSPLDQERLLAVAHHRTIEWALAHDIPLYQLHYPRLVKDAEYTIDTLWPWLQEFTDRDTALGAFHRISDPL